MFAPLRRQICAQNRSHNGYLPLIVLSAKWKQAFAESIIGTGEDKSLVMQPSKLPEFMAAAHDAFERSAGDVGGNPSLRELAGREVPQQAALLSRSRKSIRAPGLKRSEACSAAQREAFGGMCFFVTGN